MKKLKYVAKLAAAKPNRPIFFLLSKTYNENDPTKYIAKCSILYESIGPKTKMLSTFTGCKYEFSMSAYIGKPAYILSDQNGNLCSFNIISLKYSLTG